jgi:Ca-activated chloride channel family protein
MAAFRYEKWDEDFLRRLKEWASLQALFRHLLLQTNGDVEQALRAMRRLQEMGYLDASVDLDAFRASLERDRIIDASRGFPVLTPKGEGMIRREALNEVFGSLRRGGFGEHRTPHAGEGGERLPETRPYRFGEDLRLLDLGRTFRNTLLRTGPDLRLGEQDFEVHETEHLTSCATVLLVDISHSMVLYGEDRITPAKKVALALAELIRTRYPKDSLDVILFGDDAIPVPVERLPYVGAGPYHTNTRAALQRARSLLAGRRNPNRQIFMVTDGKPSAIWEEGRLYKNPFGLDPKIVARTLEEAVACRRQGIVITTFMLTDDPTLVDFIHKLTRVNRGRAYFSTPDRLGESVFVDYLRNRKKKIGH